MDVLSNINLDGNQIINLVLEKLPASPLTTDEGRIYYNTTDGIIYYRKNGAWVPLTDGVRSVTTGANSGIVIGGTVTDPTISANVDGISIEVVGNQIRIKDSGVTTSKVKDLAITTAKVDNAGITFAKIQDIPTMTVIGRVVGGSGSSSAITIINSDTMTGASATTLATSSSIKAYIDSSISSLGKLIGSYDANTSTNYPGGPTTKKGDYWYVTVAGTVQGQAFNIGDVIMANQDAPTVTNGAHYITLESNRDAATTTVLGLVKLATNAEVLAGTGGGVVTAADLGTRTATENRSGLATKAKDAEIIAGTENTKFVTPKQLKDSLPTGASFTALIGGSASQTVTHTLNSLNVIGSVYRVSTNELVHTDMKATTANTFTVGFATAPAANSYRLVLIKV